MAKANDPIEELRIRNLIARLAHVADMASEEELDTLYLPLFTEDAVWEALPGAIAPGQGLIRNDGIDKIRASAVERRRSGAAGPGGGSMHMVMTTEIEIEGDAAIGHSCFMVINADKQISTAARYEDRLRRVGGEWRMAHRQVKPR
jgi:hypothetical protein